ncbi:MAG: hypothetical protein U9R50_07425 [Campylobacterota bacterium]|nr:hypothetical protein [Campylobacterota bacterium]
MKVNNYAVDMNAHYFNLQRDYTQAKLSTQIENFAGDKSVDIKAAEADTQISNSAYDELSVELSRAIVKNVYLESHRSLRDTLEMSYTYEEKQSLNFQVQAYIQSDTKEISVSLDVSLSRSFLQKSSVSIESLQQLKDPLVLSFDGTMPSLSSQTFSFDIDSDGESEQISKLGAGSAFLALDKNSNGKIDNGMELFGTQSGDGFSDLKAYDDDSNGWIDENDAIFDKLRIWQKNEGAERLIGLGEVGIGAIFLGNTQTPFSLKSDSNALLGEIRSSSFFVYESGKAGLVSQVDLMVSKETKNDLKKVEDLQKDLSVSSLGGIYNSENKKSEDFGEKQLEKLQKKLNELEKKLLNAEEDHKAALQAEIGALYSQIMAILEARLST